MIDLRDGDEILTYDGHDVQIGLVSRHHCTGVKEVLALELDDGTVVELTAAHPVLTARGYVYAGDLTDTDDVVRRDLCTFYGTDTSGRRSPAVTGSRRATAPTAGGYGSTAMPGSRSVDPFPRGVRSITSTVTGPTTTLGTCSASLAPSTTLSTKRSASSRGGRLGSRRILSRCGRWLQRHVEVSTSALASSVVALSAYAPVRAVARSFALAKRTLTTLYSALCAASRRRVTSTLSGSITALCPASSALSPSYPAPMASGTRSSVPSPAGTSTATLRSTSRASALGAGMSWNFEKVQPRDTASSAETQAPTSTAVSAQPVGARFYPASRMVAYSAIESVLTSTEDSRVTQRSMNDSARQFVRVVSIRPIGFQPTYNFEVEGTRNFLVHGGIVVHNCVDALAWAVRLTLTKSAPKAQEPVRLRSWKDKLPGLGAEGASHMSA